MSVTDVSAGGYTVSCTVTDNVGVTRVTFPTWTVAGGQDDILEGGEDDDGYLGTRDGDTWSFRVLASDHGGEAGEYLTHVYAWDAAGNRAKLGDDGTTLVEVPEQGPDLSKDGWVDLPNGAKGYAVGGSLVTGWFDMGSAKYYFQPDGSMSVGWADVVVDGKGMHYYFNPASGNLVRGIWFQINGSTYYFRPSGAMQTGWKVIDGKTYYFRASGAMQTGEKVIDGVAYTFDDGGVLVDGGPPAGAQESVVEADGLPDGPAPNSAMGDVEAEADEALGEAVDRVDAGGPDAGDLEAAGATGAGPDAGDDGYASSDAVSDRGQAASR